MKNETVPFLKLENISKEYFGNRVLSDVSFSVNKGEILGLVGENGAGKSTLMKILFGMPVISKTGGFEGKILIDGKESRFLSPQEALKAGIGMVHQEFSLIPGFTAAENIVLNTESLNYNIFVEIFGEGMHAIDVKKNGERAASAFDRLGVKINHGMVVSEMPVGYKQFTEIAREIDRENTKLIVLDEPTAVLTESEASILINAMKKIAESGISIIFITHRLQEILDVCDRIIVLRDGQLVDEIDPAGANIRMIAEKMVGRQIDEATVHASRINTSSEIALKLENLWVDMPGETVRDISISVRKGEIFGIGGLAGQGKLGIPNGIMGLHPAGGNVILNGKKQVLNSPSKALASGMAFVSEDRRGIGLLLDEPIDWNIAFTSMQLQNKFLRPFLGGLIKWRDDRAISDLAKEYIEMLEIKCVSEKQHAVELSGGNQQKVCLAKAFAVRPDLLFISEPTRGIDVGAKKLVLETLRRYNREYGTTIVIISSELEELRSICDNIAIVDEGRISGILPSSAPSAEFGLLMLGKGKV